MSVAEPEVAATTFLKPAERSGRKFLNPVPTALGGLRIALKVLPQMLFNTAEREPKQPLGPFHTDSTVYSAPPSTGLRVTWFGHSSMLLEIDGVRVLVDPVWDKRASPMNWIGPKRFFAPTIELERLPQIDVVLVSHDHYDHLGQQTVRRLAKLQPSARWITPLRVGPILERFGVSASRVSELDWTGTVEITGTDGAALAITALPSRHFSGRSMFRRMETLWASFALRSARHNVYYGADSGAWPGLAEIGATYGPFDLTMLEIGAYNEMWKQIHMGPEGAAQAYRAMKGPRGAGLLMPIHWGLFDLALHGWREPIERMTAIAEAEGWQLWSPHPGMPTEVVHGQALRSTWWKREA
ncbi:MAG TPA: MBL fold metallo-hydrolase [Acidobacteriaceae bacterium]|nr:MBL fold metallo-hydrolase [Acidobacteriaceae bacterium]